MKLYKTLKKKEKFIENTITKFTSLIEDGLYNSNRQEGTNHGKQTSQLSDMFTQTEVYEPVTDFPKKLR